MGAARFVHAMAFVALFNGVLYLSLRQEALASEREDEAKKYTEQLRKGKDTKTKITALQELGKLGQIKKSLVADALPEIYRAVQDKDPGVRAAAAEALGKADEPYDKAGKALVTILKEDTDEGAKLGAMRGLTAMGSTAKEAVPTLREIVKTSDKKSKLGKAAQLTIKAISGKN